MWARRDAETQNVLLRAMFMSASDVLFVPDPHKDLAARDKETVIALVSLENSFITNNKYFEYVNTLPEKDRKKIRDIALYQNHGKKPRIFASIYSGVVPIPVRLHRSLQRSATFCR